MGNAPEHTKISEAGAANAGTVPAEVDPASLEIEYGLVQSYHTYSARNVQQWHFTATATTYETDDEDDEVRVEVGQGFALVVQLGNGRDPLDALDEHSQDAMDIAEAIFDPETSELCEDFEELVEPLGDRVLILDRIEIRPQYRGHGLGALFAGLAIEALSGGVIAVVCYPAPFHPPLDDAGAQREFRPGEREAAIKKLSRYWGTLGFKHYRNNVHYISTSHLVFAKSFSRHLRHLGL